MQMDGFEVDGVWAKMIKLICRRVDRYANQFAEDAEVVMGIKRVKGREGKFCLSFLFCILYCGWRKDDGGGAWGGLRGLEDWAESAFWTK